MRGLFQKVLFLLAISTTARVSSADPLDNWTWRYPIPQGCSLNAVTFANGQFVAVGDYGAIINSSDGYHWHVQNFNGLPDLFGVGGINGFFTAVGAGGTILTSTDGTNWTQQTSPTTNTLLGACGNPLNGSPVGGRLLLAAVGDNGTLVSTTNTYDWTQVNTTVTNTLRAAQFESGDVIAVGDEMTVRSTGFASRGFPSTNNYLQALLFTNGTNFYGGSTEIYTEEYGYPELNNAYAEILYTSNLLGTSTGSNYASLNAWATTNWYTVAGLAFGNNTYVAVGYTAWTLEYNYPGILMTSSDGINWAAQSYYTSPNYLNSVAFGDGIFVAVGQAGTVIVSSDGTNWSSPTLFHRTAITTMASSPNLCIASGIQVNQYLEFLNHSFSTLISSNGTDWLVSTTNLANLFDIVYGRNLFAGVSAGCVYTTTDGFNWSSYCISSNNLNGIAYGNGQFFAVGNSGSIFTSTDGTNWNNHSLNTTNDFNCAAFGNGTFLAEGTTGASSTDGTNWVLSPTNPPPNLSQMIYANGLFVAAAVDFPYTSSGAVYYSSDGFDWQESYSLNALSTSIGLAYGNGSFVALNGTTLLKSPDGINWIASSNEFPWMVDFDWDIYYENPFSGYGSRPVAVCPFNDTFLMGGADGIVMQSDSLQVPISNGSPKLTGSTFTFAFNPQAGEPFRVQTSTNLNIWSNLYSGFGNGSPTNFIYPFSPSTAAQYFRVVSP